MTKAQRKAKKLIELQKLDRGGNYCEYCGRSVHKVPFISGKRVPDWLLTIDHIIPKSKGGEDEVWNYAISCYNCNTRKGSKGIDQIKLYDKIKGVV